MGGGTGGVEFWPAALPGKDDGAGPDGGPGAAPAGAAPEGSQYTRLGSPMSLILMKQDDGTVEGHRITPAVDWYRGRPRFCTLTDSISMMASEVLLTP